MVKKLFEIAEICFVTIALTFFTGGFALGGSQDGLTASVVPAAVVTLIRYTVWAGSVGIMILNWKRTLATASRYWPLWVLNGLAIVSYAWSDYINFSDQDKPYFELPIMVCFGLYLATRFTLKQQVKLIAFALFLGGCFSTLAAIGMPSLARHVGEHAGAWKGIYDYKNTFGGMMVLGAMAFLSFPTDNLFDRIFKWFGLAFCTVLILLTTSKTALVMLVALISILLFYKLFRWRGRFSVILLSLGTLITGSVSIFLFNNWVDIVRGLGRDPTLTGRTKIWYVAVIQIWERPWFGYGRSQFWHPQSPYPEKISSFFMGKYVPPHAHNGFIDLTLDIGFVGLALFLICLITTYVLALRLAYATRKPEHLWPLAFLTSLLINNLTESFLLRLPNIYWVLFVVNVLTVRQALQHQNIFKRERMEQSYHLSLSQER